MKNFSTLVLKSATLLLLFAMIFSSNLFAQDVMIYQYRKVPQAKVEEFLKRETTYWSKVAQKGIDNGKMEFWGLLEKVSGGNGDDANYLFVNTFKNIDEAMKGEMWDATKVFPGVPISKMETNSISEVSYMLYASPQSWEQSTKLAKTDDAKFVVINYHHATDPQAFIALENKHWQPFIKGEMETARTRQVAWGNQIILSPSAGKDRVSTISVDLFLTFKDALQPYFAEDSKFPNEGLSELQKLTSMPRDVEIYRIVKMVAKQ
jgi:hypothetical protein